MSYLCKISLDFKRTSNDECGFFIGSGDLMGGGGASFMFVQLYEAFLRIKVRLLHTVEEASSLRTDI